MTEALVVDGAQGEGGGQILRTSLSLAAVTGRPVRVTNIRAGRRNPGLAAQHVVACKAVAAVCRGELDGATLHSTEIELRPRGLAGGEYEFDVSQECPSAGSTALILQAVLPTLLMSPEPSVVTLRGGTEVPWSPVFDYVAQVFAPTVRRLGAELEVRRNRAGWYPAGGGEVQARVQPLSGPLRPLELVSRGEPEEVAIHSLCEKRLPAHILARQCDGVRHAISSWSGRITCHEEHAPAMNPGTTCLAVARFSEGVGGFSSLGRAGKPAEKVGAEAGDALWEFLSGSAAVDCHLADQLLLYAALAAGTSSYLTSEATSHLHTNALVIEQLLGPTTWIMPAAGGTLVSLTGIGLEPHKR